MLITIILISGVFASENSYSQQRFKAGLTAGLSTSQVSGDDLGGFHKLGIIAGPSVTAQIKENFWLRMEMVYINKGSRKTPRADEGNVWYHLRLNYIEVPVLMRFKLRKFYYEFGPSLGVLVKSVEENHLGILPFNRPFNSTEIGFVASIGIDIRERMNFSWRFGNSIIPIRKHVANATFRLNRGQYNTAFCLMLQYNLSK